MFEKFSAVGTVSASDTLSGGRRGTTGAMGLGPLGALWVGRLPVSPGG